MLVAGTVCAGSRVAAGVAAAMLTVSPALADSSVPAPQPDNTSQQSQGMNQSKQGVSASGNADGSRPAAGSQDKPQTDTTGK